MLPKLQSLIAGPTDKSKIFRFGSIQAEDYAKYVRDVGMVLAKHLDRVDVIPDSGVPLDIVTAYKHAGGQCVKGYISRDSADILKPHFNQCDFVEQTDWGWSTLNTCLSRKSGNILVFGMSPGTLVEISYTKYFKKYEHLQIPILIDRRAFSGTLPEAVTDEISLTYFDSNDQLDLLLSKLREQKNAVQRKQK